MNEDQPEETESELALSFAQSQEHIKQLLLKLGTIIRGKKEFLKQALSCLLASGHLLIEDYPGLGKTTLAKALARIVGKVEFSRIQFTPDLLPYDVSGVDIWNTDKKDFEFSKGPVFSNILLADEINRATPKVQSALLEVMAENQVTIGNTSHYLEAPFFVIATQNPIDMEGTYPLPIAQLDRFLMSLKIGYPAKEEEINIIEKDPSRTLLKNLEPVIDKLELLALQSRVTKVYCDIKLIAWAVEFATRTREHEAIQLGVSPRGVLMLIQGAKASALLNNRAYVIDQDLVDLIPVVFRHRLQLVDRKTDTNEVIDELLRQELSKLPK